MVFEPFLKGYILELALGNRFELCFYWLWVFQTNRLIQIVSNSSQYAGEMNCIVHNIKVMEKNKISLDLSGWFLSLFGKDIYLNQLWEIVLNFVFIDFGCFRQTD
jgi:hypothetical protein